MHPILGEKPDKGFVEFQEFVNMPKVNGSQNSQEIIYDGRPAGFEEGFSKSISSCP
jgi:hypothetical protein